MVTTLILPDFAEVSPGAGDPRPPEPNHADRVPGVFPRHASILPLASGERQRRQGVLMVKRLLIYWVVLAVALALSAALLDSVTINGGLAALLGVSLIFAVVNLLLGPLLRLISLPLTVITLGLFALVVNGVLLAITAGISDNLDVGGFFGVIVAALVISVIEAVLGFVVGKLIPSGS